MAPEWSLAEAQEFIPQGFDSAHMVRLQATGFSSIVKNYRSTPGICDALTAPPLYSG
jgi:hypothetical protein